MTINTMVAVFREGLLLSGGGVGGKVGVGVKEEDNVGDEIENDGVVGGVERSEVEFTREVRIELDGKEDVEDVSVVRVKSEVDILISCFFQSDKARAIYP